MILSGQCLVFLGSGPSWGSYHPWPDLVNALCDRCGITRRITRDSPADELLNAAQDAKSADRNAYYRFLGEHFGRPVDSVPLLYDVLFSLPFECYLTINFDPMFALKARTARLPCSLPPRVYPSLDRRQMVDRSIHYLHGFIEVGATPAEGTIVLARDEFDEAYDSNLMNLLYQLLKTILSCLSDVDFENRLCRVYLKSVRIISRSACELLLSREIDRAIHLDASFFYQGPKLSMRVAHSMQSKAEIK